MSSQKPNTNPILAKAQEIKEAREEMEQKKDETLHSPSDKTKAEVEKHLSSNQHSIDELFQPPTQEQIERSNNFSRKVRKEIDKAKRESQKLLNEILSQYSNKQEKE
jgi:hypothetical protein